MNFETNWRKEFDAARDFGANLIVCSELALAESLSMGQRVTPLISSIIAPERAATNNSVFCLRS